MKNIGGFAYLYLLFLIALLSIAATAMAAIHHYDRVRSEEAELLRIGAEFRTALHHYRDNRPDHAYPTSLDELLLDQRSRPPARHLRKLYYDPITRKQDWGLVTQAGRIIGLHSMSEKEPMKVAGFTPGDAKFEGAKRYSEWVFLAAPVIDGARPVDPVQVN